MNTKLVRSLLAVAVLAMLLGAQASSEASIYTGSGTLGSVDLSAEAIFSLDDANDILTITLTNTGTSTVNATLIHGLFFNVAGDPTLGAGTAVLGTGSTQRNLDGTLYTGTAEADDGWGFVQGTDVSSEVSGLKYAIISAGYDIGGHANFVGSNTSQALDGTNWGIMNSSDPDSTNSANGGQDPKILVDNAMVFTLTGFTGTLDDISDVKFQYGTSLSDTRLTGVEEDPDFGDGSVPEPMSLAIWGSISALGAIAAYRRRKLVSKA